MGDEKDSKKEKEKERGRGWIVGVGAEEEKGRQFYDK